MKKEDSIDDLDLWFNKMLDLLSKQSYTKKEIEKKLKTKKLPNEIVVGVLDKLCEYKYIDDERFAREFIKNRIEYRSKREIEFKLTQKGVPHKIIYSVMEEFEQTNDAVVKTAEKYMKNKEADIKTLQKLYAYLFGKGFESSEISFAVNQIKNELKINKEDL